MPVGASDLITGLVAQVGGKNERGTGQISKRKDCFEDEHDDEDEDD
jgi:hypothetical protein